VGDDAAAMVIVLLGVTGSGKSTLGKALAAELGWRFVEGDDFHPAPNIDKMRRGVALTDSDRIPWLQNVRTEIAGALARGESAVVACSALRESYRDVLRISSDVKFVYLKASMALIEARLQKRQGHYMNPVLIPSQFDTLEEPKKALWIDAGLAVPEAVEQIRRALHV